MTSRFGTFAASLAMLLLAAVPCPAADPPDVDEVLKRVDAAVLFSDAQEGLKGYQVDLQVWSGGTVGGKGSAPAAKDMKPAGTLSFDAAAGTKTQEGPDEAEAAPSNFTPSCGPWTLTALAGFEAELFATPWSTKFNGGDWDREVSESGDGFRLTLTAKAPIGEPFMLKPALTGLEIEVGKDGVPTGATLHLDQKMMKDDGEVRFVFADDKGKKRIDRIENDLKSANLRIRPAMAFKFSKVQTWTLPESVEFKVAGADLSPSMGGMEMITILYYRNYAPTK